MSTVLLDGFKIMGDKPVGPVNRDIDLIVDKIEKQNSAVAIATKCMRGGKCHSGRPHVAHAIDNTIAVLMQVATDNKSDAGLIEPFQ